MLKNSRQNLRVHGLTSSLDVKRQEVFILAANSSEAFKKKTKSTSEGDGTAAVDEPRVVVDATKWNISAM